MQAQRYALYTSHPSRKMVVWIRHSPEHNTLSGELVLQQLVSEVQFNLFQELDCIIGAEYDTFMRLEEHSWLSNLPREIGLIKGSK